VPQWSVIGRVNPYPDHHTLAKCPFKCHFMLRELHVYVVAVVGVLSLTF
jgi:hypothetical protein